MMYFRKEKENRSQRPLTQRQREILNFIGRSQRYRGISPTIREICASLHIHSPSCAWGHLLALEKKGYIQRQANLSRSITLKKRKEEGTPRFLREFTTQKIFSLRVDEPIPQCKRLLEGDFLLIRPTDQLSENEIGVFQDCENKIHIGKLRTMPYYRPLGKWVGIVHNVSPEDYTEC